MMRGVTVIDSPRNPRIQAALALRERRDRLAAGLTIVDGARECRRALDAGLTVADAFTCPPLLRSGAALEAVALLRARGGAPVEVSERVWAKLTYGDRTDGLILVVAPPPVDLDHLRVGGDPLILVTEDVEKPGNLGAILRTADATACDAVIAIGGTDLFNPNVIRASVGTAFGVPLASATAAAAIGWLRGHGIRMLAARVDAEQPYSEANLRGPIAFVLGNEAFGLSGTWSGPAVEGIRLPMLGIADSLNVSAAAAVLAFEARRQRSSAPPLLAGRPGRAS